MLHSFLFFAFTLLAAWLLAYGWVVPGVWAGLAAGHFLRLDSEDRST